MRNRTTPRQRFSAHRSNAKRRNIPFLLSFEEWWKLWQDSGHWNRMGSHRGQYCMARYGDKGAYQVGNVRICLVEENHTERKPHGKNVWLNYTPERRAAICAAISKAATGKKRGSYNQGERNSAHGKNYWLDLTPEQRRLRVAVQSEVGKNRAATAGRDYHGRFV